MRRWWLLAWRRQRVSAMLLALWRFWLVVVGDPRFRVARTGNFTVRATARPFTVTGAARNWTVTHAR